MQRAGGDVRVQCGRQLHELVLKHVNNDISNSSASRSTPGALA
jgi:hypothetical protein